MLEQKNARRAEERRKRKAMEDEAKWAKSIASGDRAAFERLVDAFGPRLHRLARRYASRECEAEDLTQEIFVALFQSAGSFRGGAALSTWAYRVALNHCLRHRDRAQRQPPAAASTCGADGAEETAREEAEDREADPARQAARREMRQQVRLSLQELSDGHRDVVVLHEMHGLTYSECAAVLGIPLGTVKSRLSNALRHLRRHLGPYVLGNDQSQDQAQAQTKAQDAARNSKVSTAASTSNSAPRGEAP